MKRLLLICLALILVLSLCSCKLFDKKLFGDPDDKTVSEDPADKSDDKTEDKAPEDKSDDPAPDPQDPSGEDPIEVIPSDEQPVEDETNDPNASGENTPTPAPSSGNTDPAHVHEYDQKVIAEAYATDPDNRDDAEFYYYSCRCGARGSTTFQHEHKWKNIVADRYLVSNVVSSEDVVTEEEREALQYRYYSSCEECGKRKYNGVFDTRYDYFEMEVISEDKPYYGELISGTPTN